MTRNEWEYLFYGRTDAALKYGGATVDTVRGVVILPDNWTLPAGLSFTPGVNGWLPYHNYDSSNSFSNNNYTLEQWALMEASGAIFLPASGGRYGSRWWNDTKSYYADDNYIIVAVGYYWSVSHELTNNIFIVSENYYPQPSDIASRCWGVSVRPVLDNTI